MELLPKTLGIRPRLAIEIRPEGVVAARSEDAQALMSAVAHGKFAQGTLAPALKPGNIVDRPAVVAAVRKVLEAVVLKERAATVVVPDAAVRVLLLDFDALPARLGDALPVVRFRLKKLLPFDADDAVVSYQVMSSTRSLVRVLAVAIPRDVLAEYEGVVREAGFEPGAVLPSTLAAISGVEEMEAAALMVNAGETSVTTAIVQGTVLLLHRTVDLAAEGMEELIQAAEVNTSALPALEVPPELLAMPIVDRESTAGEWAMQEPLNGYGVIDDDRIAAEAHMQSERVTEDRENETPREHMLPVPPDAAEVEEQRLTAAAREVTQAVSVATAYFEDTLESVPGVVLSAGTMGAETLGSLLREAGFGEGGEVKVREAVEKVMLADVASSTRVPLSWMAGVRGALRS